MQFDSTTYDLGQTCLQLKDGLKFSVQQGKRQTWYLVEDEMRNQFYRLGPAEYLFISLLDGKTSLVTALAKTCSAAGTDAFHENDAIQLCKWLVDVDLARNTSTLSIARVNEQKQQFTQHQRIQKLNPLSIRLPIVELDKLAGSLASWCPWLLTWPIAIIWLLTCLSAVVLFAVSPRQFEVFQLASRNYWVWFVLSWLLLKTIHELAHVVSCKLLGGKIGKGGILFLLFVPMPFVDVTSSWRFSCKNKRILVSAAGMLAEVFVAAIATIVWCRTGPGQLNVQAANIMIAASLHTLLFNANPLMRFDGYYMLADWLEIPNLGNHGSQFVKGLGRKWFLGLPPARLNQMGREAWIVRIYGCAAIFWKILVCVGLCVGAMNLFEGIGLVMAALGVMLWLGLPTIRLLKFVIFGSEYETPNRVWFGTSVLGVALMLVGGFTWLPAPSAICAPVVVDWQEQNIVRAKTSGFVEQVLVCDQQYVAAGQLIMRLANVELESKIEKLGLDIRRADVRARWLQNEGSIGAMQAQSVMIDSLRTQLKELTAKQKQLEVRAGVSGTVVGRRIDQWQGQFVEAGTELASIENSNGKELVGLISQSDAKSLDLQDRMYADVTIWGYESSFRARIASVAPKAVDVLPHFALGGHCGGPVDVVERSRIEDSSSSFTRGKMKMVQAAVPVRFSMGVENGDQLLNGQTGLVSIHARQESLGGYLWRHIRQWLKNRITHNHGF